jgi:hypothetical protein
VSLSDSGQPWVWITRPAHAIGRNIPQFLDTQAIDLRLAIGIEGIARLHLLGQVTARPFGEQRVLGVEFHAGLVIGLVISVGSHAHVLRGNAHHVARFIEQHLAGRESGEHLHAQPSACSASQRVRLPSEPV